ncbi:MAG: hypothetical protein ACYSUV_00425 [Planctomycetota bacterium]|jgi:hypothetical protein
MSTQLTDSEQKFLDFHKQNPHIYKLFKRFAFEAVNRGRKRIGSKLIFERMRWEVTVVTSSADEFELNNNYTAYYARKFVQDYPMHGALFAFRKTRGEAIFGTQAQL